MIICDHAQMCDNSDCDFIQPSDDIEIHDANCGHINEQVNVLNIDENVSVAGSPNWEFMRKKHGL
jgi:hypothetical protein